MAKTNLGLVEFCKQALAAKLGYVYGAYGQTCTKALLDQYASMYPANNLAGGNMRKVGEKWISKRVVDCSGLIKYYMMTDKFGENPKYQAQYDTLLFQNSKDNGPISTMPDIPGVCLYMPGHTGVYIGNGEVIESAGTAYGVVKSKLERAHTGSKWTHWYKLPWITYEKVATSPTPSVDVSWDTASKSMKIGESYEALCIARNMPDKSVYTGSVEVRSTNPDIVAIKQVTSDYTSRAGSNGDKYTLTALKVGESTIIANIPGKDSASFKVTVK